MRQYVAAASGGYQAFHLRTVEWVWLVFALACALISIATALVLMRKVLAADEGTPAMKEIAKAIQEGALAYLSRQYKTIGLIVVPVAVLVFVTSTKVVDTSCYLRTRCSGLCRRASSARWRSWWVPPCPAWPASSA